MVLPFAGERRPAGSVVETSGGRLTRRISTLNPKLTSQFRFE